VLFCFHFTEELVLNFDDVHIKIYPNKPFVTHSYKSFGIERKSLRSRFLADVEHRWRARNRDEIPFLDVFENAMGNYNDSRLESSEYTNIRTKLWWKSREERKYPQWSKGDCCFVCGGCHLMLTQDVGDLWTGRLK
jgi:hypothetical protein